MLIESEEMKRARAYLCDAEQLGCVEKTVFLLGEAAYLLENIIENFAQERTIARNVGRAYGNRFRSWIQVSLRCENLSEQRLELLLTITNALTDSNVYRCNEKISEERIQIVRRLLDMYFIGWDDEARECEIAKHLRARKATRKILRDLSH